MLIQMRVCAAYGRDQTFDGTAICRAFLDTCKVAVDTINSSRQASPISLFRNDEYSLNPTRIRAAATEDDGQNMSVLGLLRYASFRRLVGGTATICTTSKPIEAAVSGVRALLLSNRLGPPCLFGRSAPLLPPPFHRQ